MLTESRERDVWFGFWSGIFTGVIGLLGLWATISGEPYAWLLGIGAAVWIGFTIRAIAAGGLAVARRPSEHRSRRRSRTRKSASAAPVADP